MYRFNPSIVIVNEADSLIRRKAYLIYRVPSAVHFGQHQSLNKNTPAAYGSVILSTGAYFQGPEQIFSDITNVGDILINIIFKQ